MRDAPVEPPERRVPIQPYDVEPLGRRGYPALVVGPALIRVPRRGPRLRCLRHEVARDVSRQNDSAVGRDADHVGDLERVGADDA